MTSEAHRLWDTCAALLRAQVSDLVWHTAFDGVRAVDYDGATLTLGVPNPLAKDRIEGRYLGLVRDALIEAGAPDAQLRLQIDIAETPAPWQVEWPAAPSLPFPPTSMPGAGLPGGPARPAPGMQGMQGMIPTPTPANPLQPMAAMGRPNGESRDVVVELNPRYTFENFVIGRSTTTARR